MTYPPGNQGYPPAYPPVASEPSKLPVYLTTAVVVLGLAAYLASFGPVLTVSADVGPLGGAELTGSGGGYPIIATLIAALLAAVSILPKAKNYNPVVAVAAVLSVLLVIAQVVSKPPGFSIGWALWLVVAFTLLQAIAAAVVVLMEAGLVSPPAPRLRYPQYPEQYSQYPQYGSAPAGYYGQPGPQGPPPSPQGPPPGPARTTYPSQYGGGYQDGPPTPPTGFPSFSPPPTSGPRQESGSAQPSQEPSPEPQSGSKPS